MDLVHFCSVDCTGYWNCNGWFWYLFHLSSCCGKFRIVVIRILLIDLTELLYGCLQQIFGLGTISGLLRKKRVRCIPTSCISSIVFQSWLPMGFHFAWLGCFDPEFGSCTSSYQRLRNSSQESIHGRFVHLYAQIRPFAY